MENIILQITEAYGQGLATRLSDQLFSIVLLVGFAIYSLRRQKQIEDKLERYMNEDRQEMKEVIRNNTHAFERIAGKLMLFLVGFGLVLFSSGCGKKVYPVAPTKFVYDSLYVHDTVIVRDTVLVADSASVRVSLSADDIKDLLSGTEDTIKKKNKQAYLRLYKDHETGLVNADCDCDTLSIQAKIYDKVHKERHSSGFQKTIVREVKFIPLVVKVLAWSGGVLWAFVIGFFIRKIWF